ncbi:MAG: insulinase family protein [Clostridia bacterium]|nr:insulinase family protein [Clostridia bacterium]
MKINEIKSELLGESYFEIEHDSGLRIFVLSKPGYSSSYALFGTDFGSVDTCFRLKGEEDYVTVPEGIAHFLEHKLFESEELDAFALFSKTGASANAFTSFCQTCYLFSCCDNFDESLEILLNFVKQPYFTEQTVQKEQGIIGQEIQMYRDDPEWQVLFNLLRAIYKNNPVRIDIAGTKESISEITAELLYKCYNTFYNFSNMALAVVGDVTVEQICAIADKCLKKEEPVEFEKVVPDEPDEPVCNYIEKDMKVNTKKFAIGFKEKACKTGDAKHIAAMNILLNIICGKTSGLYHSMLDSGLINHTFYTEYFTGRGFSIPLFGGESDNPRKVLELIKEETEKLKKEGIKEDDFSLSKKLLYGAEIKGFNDTDDIARQLISNYFDKCSLYSYMEAYSKISTDDVYEVLLSSFDKNKACLSVIY